MDAFDKMLAIHALAQQDEDYRKMQVEYDRFEQQFHKFARFFPSRIRNFLYGYQGMTYLMGNRKLLIACANMEFADSALNRVAEPDSQTAQSTTAAGD